MKHFVRPSMGLLGQVVAILLLVVIVEFAASTIFYERASHFSLSGDRARRLAEHLVIARRLVAELPAGERPAMAAELSTDHYMMAWERSRPPPPPLAPSLDSMRKEVVAWEPTLAPTDLRFRVVSLGSSSVVVGGVTLPDGSWLHFQTLKPVANLDFSPSRILIASMLAIAAMLLGGLLIRRTLQPMRLLADAADRFGSPNQTQVQEAGPGEVRRVIGAFNRMQARIHRLIVDRTQALAAVGHDLRTPLARLRLRADRVVEPDLRDTIHADVAEMEAMVSSLLAFLGGEQDAEKPVLIDLAVLCATIADNAWDVGRDARYVGPDHLNMLIRPSAMRRAIGNLVENGLHHGNAVVITLTGRAEHIVIWVDDDGPGIPPESLEAVLEPFVRLDTARRRDTVGFGLGLSIVVKAIENEGGTLRLSNRREGGLRAEIILPTRQT
ncbi:MAG: ATP-binding protein [Candidatus Sphingomonas phytovorans]|nr:ATP-binding protein [Sphingomonas sp.]WEJ97897.1 MAG: ATP-binding protein [Sphingomonas sp.]